MATKRMRAVADLVKYVDDYNDMCGVEHYLEVTITRDRVVRLHRVRDGIHSLLEETGGTSKKYAKECREVLDLVRIVKKLGEEL